MITAVIWLRSISATGISAFSGPGARTSAWKMRSVSSWRRTSVVRSIIAIVRSVDCSRRWSFSIGRPPASDKRLDDRRGPDADRVEQRDHRGRRLEVGARRREVLADRLRRRAGDDEVADVAIDDLAALVDLGRDAFHDRGGGEVLAAVPTCGVFEIGRLGLVSRVARRSPKSDVSMAAPAAGQERSGPRQEQESRRGVDVRLVTATRGRGRPMAGSGSGPG